MTSLTPEEIVLADHSVPWTAKTKLRVKRIFRGTIVNVILMIIVFVMALSTPIITGLIAEGVVLVAEWSRSAEF